MIENVGKTIVVVVTVAFALAFVADVAVTFTIKLPGVAFVTSSSIVPIDFVFTLFTSPNIIPIGGSLIKEGLSPTTVAFCGFENVRLNVSKEFPVLLIVRT